LSGPLAGAAAYHFLQTEIMRSTQYWRLILGSVILLLVLAFPHGIGGALGRFSKAGAGER
jgi:branched-chain amino acid transport system permease protein